MLINHRITEHAELEGTCQDQQCWKEHLAWNPRLGDVLNTKKASGATWGCFISDSRTCCRSVATVMLLQQQGGHSSTGAQRSGRIDGAAEGMDTCPLLMLVCDALGTAAVRALQYLLQLLQSLSVVKLCPCSPWGERELPELPSEADTEKKFGQKCASSTS